MSPSPQSSGSTQSAADVAFVLQVHSADIYTSFTNASRTLDVAISVDGTTVAKGSTAKLNQGSLDLSYTHAALHCPKIISVSVWTKHRVCNSTLCGEVRIPFFEDMDDLLDTQFTLTKGPRRIGTVRLSLQLQSPQTKISRNVGGRISQTYRPSLRPSNSGLSNLSSTSVASDTVIAKEISGAMAFIQDLIQCKQRPPVIVKFPKSEPIEHTEHDVEALWFPPSVLSIDDCDWEVMTAVGWVPWSPGVEFVAAAGEECTYRFGCTSFKATFESSTRGMQTNLTTGKRQDLRKVEPEFDGHLDASSDASEIIAQQHGRPLLGSWKCTSTQGLEGFLKGMGISTVQRKLALAARWPSWEFTLPCAGKYVSFLNRSPMGNVKEDIQLCGEEYSYTDGRGNVFLCQSRWSPTQEGGVLTTTRHGSAGSFLEQRRVEGDRLEFSMKNLQSGCSFSRSFVRVNPHERVLATA